MAKRPKQNSPALSGSSIEKKLEKIQEQLEAWPHRSSQADLIQAEMIRYYSQKAAAPSKTIERSRQRERPLTKRERSLLEVIEYCNGQRIMGRNYCREAERRKIPPNPRWIELEGCPFSYVAAYDNPKWKHRIQDEKSRLTKLLATRRSPKSSHTS